jgi:hypothetical protein
VKLRGGPLIRPDASTIMNSRREVLATGRCNNDLLKSPENGSNCALHRPSDRICIAVQAEVDSQSAPERGREQATQSGRGPLAFVR